MLMDDDLAALDGRIGDLIAARDQALASVRGSAAVVHAYLEGLENENVPEPLRSQLVRDFAAEYWRRQWGQIVDGMPDGSLHDRPAAP